MKRIFYFVAIVLLFAACEKKRDIPEANAYICFQNIDSIYELEMRATTCSNSLPETTYVVFAAPLTERTINVIPDKYTIDIYYNGEITDLGFLPNVYAYDTVFITVRKPIN